MSLIVDHIKLVLADALLTLTFFREYKQYAKRVQAQAWQSKTSAHTSMMAPVRPGNMIFCGDTNMLETLIVLGVMDSTKDHESPPNEVLHHFFEPWA